MAQGPLTGPGAWTDVFGVITFTAFTGMSFVQLKAGKNNQL